MKCVFLKRLTIKVIEMATSEMTLPAELPQILESEVTSDGKSKAAGARGIHLRQFMGLMDPLD